MNHWYLADVICSILLVDDQLGTPTKTNKVQASKNKTAINQLKTWSKLRG